MRGRIRKLKEGYGFISGDDGQDYFFHRTNIQKFSKQFGELEQLDRVEFLPIGKEDKRGPRAIEVRVIPEN